jgi:hypothetical protein
MKFLSNKLRIELKGQRLLIVPQLVDMSHVSVSRQGMSA